MRQIIGKTLLVLAVALAVPAVAQAQQHAFAAANSAADRGDWLQATVLAAPQGRVAVDLVTWQRLRAGEGSFAEASAFLDTHPDWPAADSLRAAAEKAMTHRDAAADIVAFFATRPPLTGEGAVRYAAALTEMGRPAEAQTALTAAWVGLGLDDAGEAAMLVAYGQQLIPQAWARVDAMLWRWRVSDAQRLLPLLDDDHRKLANARIALIRNQPTQDQAVLDVPDALRADPGLAYDRFNRMADRGDYSEAIGLLEARSHSAAALGQPFRWASWRGQLARWLMREGRTDDAYALAARHHLTPDNADMLADLEWVAGYVALRKMDDPARAAGHFARVAEVSSGPISSSRAAYWQGRAAQALGEDAVPYFTTAAQNQTAFYGLLGAEEIGAPLDPALAGREDFGDWRQGAFLHNDLTRAMLILLAAGDRGKAVLFGVKLGQTLPREDLGQLGAMLSEMDEPFLAVLIGKAAAERGVILPSIYYPVHPLVQLDLPTAPELALSIARRESEFNPVVGSPVGALGLMQLMPGTAEEMARAIGEDFDRARLTSDWQYNARLGSRYLADLEERFGQSPVLIAVGYNAGPGRVLQWIGTRGDPRDDGVDVVDWIESIPFTETRNYVMRVTESIPVYHARLGAGGDGDVPVTFTALLHGTKPVPRPPLRPASYAEMRQE
ncbi:lytic transglycosylase domain-containing protein [Ketogulonicigenium robustum]|nr:lytic transglycosylase domain-containing protein [Ketogulonicigenium robustum]